eukprot:2430291-Lingulodinium_polyedra.AAC.1
MPPGRRRTPRSTGRPRGASNARRRSRGTWAPAPPSTARTPRQTPTSPATGLPGARQLRASPG